MLPEFFGKRYGDLKDRTANIYDKFCTHLIVLYSLSEYQINLYFWTVTEQIQKNIDKVMYWAYESAVNCSDRIIVLVEPLVTKLISDYFYVCEYLGSAILPYVFCSCVIMDNLLTSS